MIEERADYHLGELRVAPDPKDPSHILPPIDATRIAACSMWAAARGRR